jgi:histidyl-tRNA synthetase
MSNKLQPVRGTKDLIGEEYLKHKYIIDKSSHIAKNYGFQLLATPIIEFTDVFKRTLGETADVVTKEMYSFADRGNESITLRPEFTASIARCFISNGLNHQLPLKFYCHGPLFRYERPQKCRQRQFHQINMESLGASSPYSDCEIIAMAAHILEEIGILQHTELHLNTLGDKESRDNYRKNLVEYFSDYKNELSEDSKIRLIKNPLRILDSKDEIDKKIIASLPAQQFLNSKSQEFYGKLKESLQALNIKFIESPKLVRGLDYYNDTVFEFVTTMLGTQGTVLAGGRYDGLIELMGGPNVPAVGFAGGIERLAELIDYKPQEARPISIIALNEEYFKHALQIASLLRRENFTVEISFEGDVSKKMKQANKINSKLAIFIGEEEIKNNMFKVKNLDLREEFNIPSNQLIDKLANIV